MCIFDNYTPGSLECCKTTRQTSASLIRKETYMDKGTVKTYETAYALLRLMVIKLSTPFAVPLWTNVERSI